nr:MAG TPA: hypothetical protein [Caudoviricetes sp.]
MSTTSFYFGTDSSIFSAVFFICSTSAIRPCLSVDNTTSPAYVTDRFSGIEYVAVFELASIVISTTICD